MYKRQFESPEANNLIKSHRATKLFLSASGVHEKLGITCAHNYEVLTKRAVISSSLTKIPVSYTHLVWAIGADGKPASTEYAKEKHAVIRKTLCEIFGDNGYAIPLLYGGSVNPSNADNLILQPDIDGLFVGRSAWNAADFNSLIRSAIDKVLLLR